MAFSKILWRTSEILRAGSRLWESSGKWCSHQALPFLGFLLLPSASPPSGAEKPQEDNRVVSDRRVVHHAGLFAVPVRWVLIRDPEGEFKPQALLYTNLESVDGFDYLHPKFIRNSSSPT